MNESHRTVLRDVEKAYTPKLCISPAWARHTIT